MEKQELLSEIKNAASSRLITRREMETAYESGIGTGHSAVTKAEAEDIALGHRVGIGEILYFIGGSIVFIGICVFIFQHWDQLTSAVQVLSTLGSAILAFLIGLFLRKSLKVGPIGQAFFFISALVLPVAIGVLFDHAGADVSSAGSQSAIALICLAAFGGSYFYLREKIFIIFNILFGTWLFFALTGWITVTNYGSWAETFFEYRVLAAGIVYLALGRAFANSIMHALSGWLYGFGAIGILGAAISLGGYTPNASAFWEIFFLVIVFGIIFLSVTWKSRALLVFGVIFLMGYVLKITFEYFSQSLSWALALIISGLLLIAIGYLAYYLNNAYLKPNAVKLIE